MPDPSNPIVPPRLASVDRDALGVPEDGWVIYNTDALALESAKAGAWAAVGGTQTLQTQSRFNLTLSGNTSGALALVSSGVLTLAGGANVTLSQAGNAVTVSAGAGGGSSLGVYGSSQTTGESSSSTVDSRSVTLVGAGAVSVGLSGGSIVISGATAAGGNQSVGMSDLGNTSGTTGMATGPSVRFVLAGGNNITLSQSLDGASGTITISAPNAVAQSVQSLGIYHSSQTTGESSSSTHDARSITFVGRGGLTVGASGGSIILSGATGGGPGGGFSAGVSNLGDTAGATGVSGTRLVLVGSGGVTLSQTTDANGATVSILPPPSAASPMSHWQNFPVDVTPLAIGNLTNSTRTLWVFPLDPTAPFPAPMTISTLRMLVSASGSTASMSGQHSMGISFGLYRISASDAQSTLSLVNSASSSWTHTTRATSSAAAAYNGIRFVSFHSSQWSADPVLAAGAVYFGALIYSWSGVSFNTFAFFGGSVGSVGTMSGDFNAASNTNRSRGFHPHAGIYTVSTTAFPASIHLSDIEHRPANVNSLPWLELDMLYSSR